MDTARKLNRAPPSSASPAPRDTAARVSGPDLVLPIPILSLDELTYCVLDLETTGGAPPEHRITEVAAYRVERLEVTEAFHSLVNPKRSIPSFVSSLTGITSEMLRKSPHSAVVLAQLA